MDICDQGPAGQTLRRKFLTAVEKRTDYHIQRPMETLSQATTQLIVHNGETEDTMKNDILAEMKNMKKKFLEINFMADLVIRYANEDQHPNFKHKFENDDALKAVITKARVVVEANVKSWRKWIRPESFIGTYIPLSVTPTQSGDFGDCCKTTNTLIQNAVSQTMDKLNETIEAVDLRVLNLPDDHPLQIHNSVTKSYTGLRSKIGGIPICEYEDTITLSIFITMVNDRYKHHQEH